MRSRLAHARALATFEIRQQLREPLTALYALVLLLLMAGFTGSDVVNLVSDRGPVPATSTWSLWMAVGGLTAFGQVITTMVATSAVLRDDAERTTSLVATAGVDVRVWLLARLVAAWVVLSIVFLAIPIGALIGGLFAPGGAFSVFTRATTAFVLLVAPTMVLVGAAVGVAGALSRRVVVALVASLALLGLWQLALVLVDRPSTMLLAAMLDPFGNAPMMVSTTSWDTARRSGGEAPISELLLMNRALWIVISGVIVGIGWARVRWEVNARSAASVEAIPRVDAYSTRSAQHRPAPSHPVVRSRAVVRTMAVFTAQWIFREGAWRAVLGLALANALLNALFDSSVPSVSGATPLSTLNGESAAALSHTGQVLSVVLAHARVFLILMATVYAGEIVWRERDQRTHELVDALPISTFGLAFGRIGGLILIQTSAAMLLSVGALLVVIIRSVDGASLAGKSILPVWAAWSLFHLWLPFVLWGIASVAVHVLIRHKVAAHFFIISGWVSAVILDTQGATTWWYRYAEPAPLLEGSGLALDTMLWRGGYWSIVGVLLICACATTWPRGDWTRGGIRRVTSRR